jgi:hypothetical protein
VKPSPADVKPSPAKLQATSPTLAKRAKIFFSLDWLAPFIFFPHGVSGAIALVLGLAITLSSLFGSYYLLNTYALHIYSAAIFINASSGLVITSRAPAKSRPAFRFACVQQMGLIWFAFRFRPVVEFHFPLETQIDVAMTVGILCANVVFVHQSVTMVRKDMGNAVMIGVLCGVFGITLMVGYPIHMALGGDEWLACTVGVYPKQLEGFSGYVYVPTTWMFAAMLFGATLLNRKMITGKEFGVIFGIGVIGILVLTVLSQEVHIPFVSTQRLIIPCPAAKPGTWLKMVVDCLDTSILAQNFLTKFGMEFIPPASKLVEL